MIHKRTQMYSPKPFYCDVALFYGWDENRVATKSSYRWEDVTCPDCKAAGSECDFKATKRKHLRERRKQERQA